MTLRRCASTTLASRARPQGFEERRTRSGAAGRGDAHGPFFTRNLLILTDSAGHTGVGEVPGGEKMRQTLEDARELVLGQRLGSQQRLLQHVEKKFADRDSGGRGLQTFDLRTTIHAVAAIQTSSSPRRQIAIAL